jgi:DNA-binding CsgD family transcriptional regulator
MVEQVNGQRDHPRPKRHNAKLCPFTIRQRIVNALANGDSIRAIACALHVSNNTVVAIREQDWQQLAARKERIAAQAELNATLAANRITDELQSNKHIPLNVLVPVFGVNVDKSLALRTDNIQRFEHHHTHSISDEDILAFAVARAQQHPRETN